MKAVVEHSEDIADDPDLPVPAPAAAEAPEPDVADDPDDEPIKPLYYAALLTKKSEAPDRIQEILAQVRSEHGNLPEKLVYRVHSDRGGEFVNAKLADYLKFLRCALSPQHKVSIPI